MHTAPGNRGHLLPITMNPDDTLLGRCRVALGEAMLRGAALTREQKAGARRGTAAVLEHLAAELLVMNQRSERLSVHEVARLLVEAAQEVAA